jgi:hypothetical protein
LLERNVLPSAVELRWQSSGLHLKAEHKFTWNLDRDDRASIREWEKVLNAADVKQVPYAKLLEPVQGKGTTARR